METFKIELGDLITIKDENTLKSEGQTNYAILALAGLTLKVADIIKLSKETLGYITCNPNNPTQFVKSIICDSEIAKINHKNPQLIII